jgi:hypothetical protein
MQQQFKTWLAAAALAAILGTTSAFGEQIAGLYNTGVNGTVIPEGTQETHYSLVSVPGGGAGTNWVVSALYPFWTSVAEANWISAVWSSSIALPVGSYIYRLTFTLQDLFGHPLDPTTASIRCNLAADDSVTILLNGTTVASGGGYGYLTSFSIPSGFQSGTNTLDFVVYNKEYSASGLLVSELSGTAEFPGPITTIRMSQVEVCWNTFSNMWCQLQYRSDLTTNQWVPFTTDWMLGDGFTHCTNDTVLANQPTRFYRVAITNAP